MEASTASLAESASPPRLRSLWLALRPDAPFYALLAGFVVSAVLMHRFLGYPREVDFDLSWELLALRSLIYAIPALVVALGWAMIREGRSLRSIETWRATLARFFCPGRTLAFVLLCLALPPFMSAFVTFKASIPDVHPFALDGLFMRMDGWLHFGHQPWEILQPLLGTPPVTAAIDFTYSLWFAVLWLTVIWQTWHGSYFSDAREQFLLAFAACWILLGVGLATLLSSAGPVYYGFVTGDAGSYGDLLAYLHSVDATRPLKAIWIQDVLWQGYVDPGNSQYGEGISAMPSLHVSMAVLMALVGFRVNRIVGLLYSAFGLLIMIGSVALAWHYAVDGYLAAVLTIVIWWGAGRITEAWKQRQNPAGQLV